MGRSALDAESVELIQATHPDIDFDWPQILKGRQEPVPDRPRQDPSGRSERNGRPGDKPERRGRPDAPRRPERRGPVPESTAPRSVASPVQPPATEPDPPIAATGPAADRLGSAGLQRLRGRYAEIVARIQARVDDDERRTELNVLAARLNPDEWASDSAVVAGLEGYEATYEELKNAIGGRRKPPAPAEAPEASDPGASTAPDRSE